MVAHHIVSLCCADCRRPQETLHILTPEVDISPMVGWCWDKKILISYLYKRTLTGNTHFKTRGNSSLQVVVQKHKCFNLPTAPESGSAGRRHPDDHFQSRK
ncbi:uncharacterized protein LOC141897249 [Acropora palmata]|uniref:uncharacterized protein LOC141897249 n=1 Tax=Acropora palmata TaxID=6131 RepID=UPI003D9FFCCE